MLMRPQSPAASRGSTRRGGRRKHDRPPAASRPRGATRASTGTSARRLRRASPGRGTDAVPPRRQRRSADPLTRSPAAPGRPPLRFTRHPSANARELRLKLRRGARHYPLKHRVSVGLRQASSSCPSAVHAACTARQRQPGELAHRSGERAVAREVAQRRAVCIASSRCTESPAALQPLRGAGRSAMDARSGADRRTAVFTTRAAIVVPRWCTRSSSPVRCEPPFSRASATGMPSSGLR